MNLLLSDLIGKLQPERFEKKKEFVQNGNVLLNVLGFVHERLAALALHPDLGDFERIVNDALQAHPGRISIQSCVDAAPECYPLLHKNQVYAAHAHAALLTHLMSEKRVLLRITKPLYVFGAHYHQGTLTVNGSLAESDFTFLGMQSGYVRVKGSVGNHCGQEMSGGKLIIEGNAKSHLGDGMRKGKIIVHGHAGDFIGQYSSGGIIQVLGNRKPDIGSDCSAQVYHRNKRIQ